MPEIQMPLELLDKMRGARKSQQDHTMQRHVGDVEYWP
jgi:hypothetical protein